MDVQDGGEARYILSMVCALKGRTLREITMKLERDVARKAYSKAGNATINRQGITSARALINYDQELGWGTLP